ncbi:uncharacterized protein LOC136081402 [Hydra vulgaris]|uniref:ATP-dependent DNA helicase n=1 Tax=Hydra vulgaris TaxID=6087 RepID=A0ABM4BZV0_HYDVU
MAEVEDEEICRAAIEGCSVSVVKMSLLEEHDRRRYNLPSHNKVADVFVSEDGAPPAFREVVIYPRGSLLKTISSMSANLDPMVYPLFFPRGNADWHNQLVHSPERTTLVRNHVTLSQYYNYKFLVRQFFSSLFYGKKLFQQYTVDAYVKIEGQRVGFIRNNQNKLRSEQYDALHEHVSNLGNDNNVRPGRVVVLPSTYVGSPRALNENFEDAMAIIKNYGKPDLFITFSCNPKWCEITENLYPGQTANDKPNLFNRVFILKLNNLLNDIFKDGVVGEVVTHVQFIEFQMRGLPHVHILLHFANDNKLETAHDINNFISADVPNPIVNRDLYDVVKTCMIHGPCGVLNPNSPCMKDGVCSKTILKNLMPIQLQFIMVIHSIDVVIMVWLSILKQAKGATSWEDVRTVNGIVLETFREACVLKGLLQDDTEWQNTLSEAVLTHKLVCFLLDETPMIPKHALNAIDRLLKDICNNNFPFGGKFILFDGDIR